MHIVILGDEVNKRNLVIMIWIESVFFLNKSITENVSISVLGKYTFFNYISFFFKKKYLAYNKGWKWYIRRQCLIIIFDNITTPRQRHSHPDWFRLLFILNDWCWTTIFFTLFHIHDKRKLIQSTVQTPQGNLCLWIRNRKKN